MATVDYILLQEVWRKSAIASVRIPCPDEASAHRLRFALYNAVKRFKRPGFESEADDALRTAINTCSVTFEPGDKKVVIVGPAGVNGLESTILQALGQAATDKRTPLERKAEESLQRLQGIAPVEGTARTTPYFTRD